MAFNLTINGPFRMGSWERELTNSAIFNFVSPRGELRSTWQFFGSFLVNSIQRRLAAIREDRRADYLWDTKDAAQATGLSANKFGIWWRDNREKLLALFVISPAETHVEIATIAAEAAERIKEIGS